MKTPWDTDTAARWQQLMSDWELARDEHRLAATEAEAETSDGAATSARTQRIARAQARLDQLQADIDQLIAKRGLARHPEDRAYVEASLASRSESKLLDDGAEPSTSGARKKG